jgi:prepilin-type N-terminal cleavage/methylation domain-containing protein
VKRTIKTYARSQNGYTLVEVVLTAAIGAILMSALTSVTLTSVRAGNIATSRIEASGQIRNFQFYAYDDFAGSDFLSRAVPSTCPAPPASCSIALSGTRASNTFPPATEGYWVTYSWNGDTRGSPLDRNSKHVASGVTAFSWSVEGAGVYRTVIVNLTVKVGDYSESQTFRFFPRVNPNL